MARKYFGPHVLKHTDSKATKLLICDNLDGQTQDEFRDVLEGFNTKVWFGPANFTDSWQPADAGAGALLQHYVGQCYDDWLRKKEMIGRWANIC